MRFRHSSAYGTIIAPVLLGVLAAVSAAAQDSPPAQPSEPAGSIDWPNFLGPAQTGVSPETGFLTEWGEEGPPLLWHRKVGEAYSAPVTAGGRLIVFHRVKDEEVIECLDSETGEPVWEHRYPTRYEDRYGYNNGPRSSPLIDGERVFTYGAEGVLTCVRFDTGERVWQRPLNTEYQIPQGFFGAGTAPVMDDGRLLLNIGATDGASIVALDPKTGETFWQTGSDEASYSTPVVAEMHGKQVAFFFTREGLRVIETPTGKELAGYPFRSRIHESVNAASPVLVGDQVFLSSTYNVGSALLRVKPDFTLEEIWTDREAMQNHWATSIEKDGFIYGMDGRHEAGSNFRCIELATGKVRWTADEGLGRASFIMADNHLIALGERGSLALIEVSPDRYIEKARVRALRYPCWTPPVLSHGLLYIRNERVLACLDLRIRG